MGKYDNLKKQLNTSTEKINSGTNKLTAVNTEMRRVADVAHNAQTIIDDIDERFAQATKLNKLDIAFLFAATALQCARWILMPSLDLDFKQTPPNERLTSQQGAQIEKSNRSRLLMSIKIKKLLQDPANILGGMKS